MSFVDHDITDAFNHWRFRLLEVGLKSKSIAPILTEQLKQLSPSVTPEKNSYVPQYIAAGTSPRFECPRE